MKYATSVDSPVGLKRKGLLSEVIDMELDISIKKGCGHIEVLNDLAVEF